MLKCRSRHSLHSSLHQNDVTCDDAISLHLTRNCEAMLCLDYGKKRSNHGRLKRRVNNFLLLTNTLMPFHGIFSQTLQHNSLVLLSRAMMSKQQHEKKLSVNSLLSFFRWFSSLMLWVTVHVSISAAFQSANVKLRWFTDIAFRFRLFVFTRRIFGWNSNISFFVSSV